MKKYVEFWKKRGTSNAILGGRGVWEGRVGGGGVRGITFTTRVNELPEKIKLMQFLHLQMLMVLPMDLLPPFFILQC